MKFPSLVRALLPEAAAHTHRVSLFSKSSEEVHDDDVRASLLLNNQVVMQLVGRRSRVTFVSLLAQLGSTRPLLLAAAAAAAAP